MKTKLAFKTQEGKAEVISYYETLLEHWMKPNEQFTVPTRFGEAFVISCGEKDAPPLLLLHGSAMNSVMWLGDAPLHDVFEALGIQKASLVGISLGAWLADKFASCYPERVEKLVLLSPAGVGAQRSTFNSMNSLFRLLGEKMTRRLYNKVNGNQVTRSDIEIPTDD